MFFFVDFWLFASSSNPPKKARLSRNLVALLSYGGVPNDFFLNILRHTLEESKTIFYRERPAFKGAKNLFSFLVRLQFRTTPETTELN